MPVLTRKVRTAVLGTKRARPTDPMKTIKAGTMLRMEVRFTKQLTDEQLRGKVIRYVRLACWMCSNVIF